MQHIPKSEQTIVQHISTCTSICFTSQFLHVGLPECSPYIWSGRPSVLCSYSKSCNIPYTCEDMWVVLLPYYFHVRNPYSVWEDCGNGVQCPTSAELNFNGMVKADNWNG